MVPALLKMDIEVLSSHVDRLYWCYKKIGITDSFPSVLERLRVNINDIYWQRKLSYFHVLCALGKEWDEEAGRREIRKLEPIHIDEETDVEILQLYLDLCGRDQSFSYQQALIDRIVALAHEPIHRLQYRCMRGVNYLLIGDQQKARDEVAQAIAEYRAVRQQDEETSYQMSVFGQSLGIQSAVASDVAALDEAIGVYDGLSQAVDLTRAGKAMALKAMADLYRAKEDYQAAVELYRQSTELEQSGIAEVCMSEALFGLGDLDAAVEIIAAVNSSGLDEAATFDHALVFSAIAVGTGDPQLLARAEALLRAVGEEVEPYFREKRDSMLLSVVEAKLTGRSKTVTKKAWNLLRNATRVVRQCLILQPNFMGIGIDIGKALREGTELGSNWAEIESGTDSNDS